MPTWTTPMRAKRHSVTPPLGGWPWAAVRGPYSLTWCGAATRSRRTITRFQVQHHFLWASSRRLAVQEETNKRHQCESDHCQRKGEGQSETSASNFTKRPTVETGRNHSNSYSQRTKGTQSKRRNTLIPRKAQNVQTKPTAQAIKLFTRKKQSWA